jgi:hypothetical protein
MKGRKNQHFHPADLNFVNWLRRYSSTKILHCIALLQMFLQVEAQVLKIMDTSLHVIKYMHISKAHDRNFVFKLRLTVGSN